jgi:hypothetical protein
MQNDTDEQDVAANTQAAKRIAELKDQIDDRDETIRLLNEALSLALDELSALDEAA